MTGQVFLEVFGAPIVGVVAAVGWWMLRRRGASVSGTVAVFAVLAGIVAVLGDVLLRVAGSWSLVLPFHPPVEFVLWYFDNLHVVPLAVGVVGVVLLAFPVQRRGGGGAAELAPRSPLRFVRRRWLIAPGVLLVIAFVMSVVTGATGPSEDVERVENGVVTAIVVNAGGLFPVWSVIAGLIALVVAAAAGLTVIARPALAADREADIAVRTIRTRNIVTAVTATLLSYLGLLLVPIARAASAQETVATAEGSVSLWNPVAALQPILVGTSLLAFAIGVALWTTIALTVVPVRQRSRRLVAA